ncbi:hypothetical protein ACIRS3_34845, partial [Streptomyces virginiae]|uniref:NHL domain-containing protein n=1 Tax=Streptomyces virginiae TaxID=1961 RepID=UPI003813F6FC
RKVTREGIITTFAGNGQQGSAGDGGQATAAELNCPVGVAVDAAGDLYIADSADHRVRRVTREGIITTFAGNGQRGDAGDGGQATAAELSHPVGVVVDAAGDLYIADSANHRVRKVTREGIITTFAGNGQQGSAGDGGQATAAELGHPMGVAVDGAENLYIADFLNHRVRRVTREGIITTFAGSDQKGYAGDGGPATAASLSLPSTVAVDGAESIYITDRDNHRVRKVTRGGIITTVAGTGVAGEGAEGIAAVEAQLYLPWGVIVAPSGDLYFSDRSNNRVRKVCKVAAVTPLPPPVADLYGEVVHPVVVPHGQEFDLGARIRNRGPATADGQDITVVLTLADGLESVYAANGPRLTRSFNGTKLAANDGSLDGVFRLRAADSAKAGTYENTLEIQYGGDLNLKDNTFALPVTLVVPQPVADEHALTITQENIPEADPGQSTHLILRYTAPAGQPVNPGIITHRITAPTGFTFTGQATSTYPDTIQGAVTGSLDDHEILDGGRTLVIRANPHLNTTETDTGTLVYTISLTAQPDAQPGAAGDGSASIGQRPPVQIRATVTGTTVKPTVDITQAHHHRAQVKPGQQGAHPAVFKITNTGPAPLAPHHITFTAPEGLRFARDQLHSWDDEEDRQITLDATRSDNNRTLTVPGAALGLNPNRWALLYPALNITADATPGEAEVTVRIGSTSAFVTGHATITISIQA